jgi:hypothetical protein
MRVAGRSTESLYVAIMELEAFLVIGGFALILGLVLFIPAHFLVRHRIRADPAVAKQRVTRYGLVAYSILVCGLVLTYASRELFDERASVLALFGGTILMAIYVVIAGVSKLKGIDLVEESSNI